MIIFFFTVVCVVAVDMIVADRPWGEWATVERGLGIFNNDSVLQSFSMVCDTNP